MDYLSILNKWAHYTHYDTNQTSFNLLSHDHYFHETGKTVEYLLHDYDPTGMLAVIYIRYQLEKVFRDTSVNLWKMMSIPGYLDEEKEMYDLLTSGIADKAYREFILQLNEINTKVVKDRLIGIPDKFDSQIPEYFEGVIQSMKKTKAELFRKGGIISPNLHFSTRIHVFGTLAQCLIALEKAKEGIYLCFISAGNTADCYFSFFIASNGNILSVNDRIDEAYIGQHANSRNGRWSEDKADGIFPYDHIFKYSDYDYKGYASTYDIDDSNLSFFELSEAVYMPLVIAMMLIVMKHSGKEASLPMRYLDSFLYQNKTYLTSENVREIMTIDSSSIIEAHQNIHLDFETEKVMTGAYSQEFTSSDNYWERGCFSNSNQIMIDLWGKGFNIDNDRLMPDSSIKRIAANDSFIPEFVGSKKRLRLQAYYNARKQLANHMEDQIYQAWLDFGKTDAVIKWYKNAIIDHLEDLYGLMIELEEEAGKNTVIRKSEPAFKLYIMRDTYYPATDSWSSPHFFSSDIINVCRDVTCASGNRRGNWKCSVNGCTCNLWFGIVPENWKALEYLTGAEVPKIVKGWKKCGHSSSGNSLLSVTDAVEEVGTPFEKRNYHGEYDTDYDFQIILGFSKSGWQKLKKIRDKKENKVCV